MLRKLFIFMVLTASVSGSAFAADPASGDPAAPSSENSTRDEAAAAGKGSIKLRIVAVNPSKEKVQKVPIKIYLPKEVIPDDIIDMGTLKVGYDSEKGLYFAYEEAAELKPGETRIFEVKLEDVWRVKDKDISKVRDQTRLALQRLEKTEHFAQAKAIVDSIDRRLNEIEVKQNDDSVSREEHIGAYRVNVLAMNQIKSDIEIIEKMLLHTGQPPSVELLKDTVFEKKDDLDKITAWKLILAIIGFLALLGVGFYFRWFMLMNSSRLEKVPVKNRPLKVSEHVEDHMGFAAKGAEKAEKVPLNENKPDQRKAG